MVHNQPVTPLRFVFLLVCRCRRMLREAPNEDAPVRRAEAAGRLTYGWDSPVDRALEMRNVTLIPLGRLRRSRIALSWTHPRFAGVRVQAYRFR
jgi:hypothetical protein